MNYVFETTDVEYDTPVYSMDKLDIRDAKALSGMSQILQETVKSMVESRGLVHTQYDAKKQLVTYTFELLEQGIPTSPTLANPKSMAIQF